MQLSGTIWVLPFSKNQKIFFSFSLKHTRITLTQRCWSFDLFGSTVENERTYEASHKSKSRLFFSRFFFFSFFRRINKKARAPIPQRKHRLEQTWIFPLSSHRSKNGRFYQIWGFHILSYGLRVCLSDQQKVILL